MLRLRDAECLFTSSFLESLCFKQIATVIVAAAAIILIVVLAVLELNCHGSP